MRTSVPAIAAVAAASLLVASPALAGWGFRLGGGYGYLAYGDWNDLVHYDNTTAFPSHGVLGRAKEIHWAPEFSGEALHTFNDRTTLGIGTGAVLTKADFTIEERGASEHFIHRIMAIPVTGTLYFRFPEKIPFVVPYIAVGLALNFARIHFENDIAPAPVDSLLRTADLWGWRIGFQGGAGFELPVSERVSIDFGVHGRFAEVSGFEGTGRYYDGSTSDVFLAHFATGEVTIFEPQRTEFRNIFKDGTVDFSGVAVILAVKVTL
jgi:opacity protein-like surface antigen